MAKNTSNTSKQGESLNLQYGGMTLGSLLRKLRSDKSLDGVRDEILERVTARHAARDAAKSKRELESQQKNNDGNS